MAQNVAILGNMKNIRFQCLATWFSKKSQVVKNNSSNFFLQGVTLENGVLCGAFDDHSCCISWHVYLIFQHFNTENEFADQGQNLFVCMMLGRKSTSMVSRKTIITAITCWHDWYKGQSARGLPFASHKSS